MKLRKQAAAKAFIVAATAGLFLGFLGLIRAEPRLNAESAAPEATPVDYERFFAPSQPRAGETSEALPPRTRTRGS